MSDIAANDPLPALRRRYAASLPAKVAKASESVGAFLEALGDSARREAAHRSLHSLIGSSGTYGFTDLSRAARSAETLLRQAVETGAPPTPAEGLLLRDLLAGLASLAASAAAESGAGAA